MCICLQLIKWSKKSQTDNFAIRSLSLTSVSGQQRKAYKNDRLIHNLNCSICLELFLHELPWQKATNISDMSDNFRLANLCCSQQAEQVQLWQKTYLHFQPQRQLVSKRDANLVLEKQIRRSSACLFIACKEQQSQGHHSGQDDVYELTAGLLCSYSYCSSIRRIAWLCEADLESGTGIDISLHTKGNFTEFSGTSKEGIQIGKQSSNINVMELS